MVFVLISHEPLVHMHSQCCYIPEKCLETETLETIFGFGFLTRGLI